MKKKQTKTKTKKSKELKPKSDQYVGELKAIGEVKDRDKWTSETEKKKLSFFSRKKLEKEPEVTYFVTIFFPNGTCKEWVISSKNTTFDYKGRTFVIDTQESWFDITQNQYRLLYHFEYPMPIRREVIPFVDEGNEVYLRIKSDNLKPVIKQEYVKVLASSNIDRYLIIMLVLLALLLFFSIGLAMITFVLARNIQHLASVI